jgi:hypothetical protein
LSRRSLFFVAVVLALVIAACGDDVTDTTSTTTGPTTTVAPTTTEAPTTTVPPATTTSASTTTSESESDTNDLASGSGCTPGGGPLPDGEWFGLVTSRADDSIEFDLACWFTGDAATQAAAEDGEESPPPNDYYVRNANPETREVPVATGAEVVFYPDGDPNNEETIAYADWAARVDQRGYELGVWLEVEEGSITEIREQWVP